LSIRIALHHRTEYAFDRPVRLAPHVVRLRPAPHCRTRIESYSLVVEPRARHDHAVHAPRLDPVKGDRNDSRDHGSVPLWSEDEP
jgi:hypothetical protein